MIRSHYPEVTVYSEVSHSFLEFQRCSSTFSKAFCRPHVDPMEELGGCLSPECSSLEMDVAWKETWIL